MTELQWQKCLAVSLKKKNNSKIADVAKEMISTGVTDFISYNDNLHRTS